MTGKEIRLSFTVSAGPEFDPPGGFQGVTALESRRRAFIQASWTGVQG
jgi:hypothetical protein